MAENKWRKKHEAQVEANNLLSDRLRSQRAWSTRVIGQARRALLMAQEEIVKLNEQKTFLLGVLEANGIEITNEDK